MIIRAVFATLLLATAGAAMAEAQVDMTRGDFETQRTRILEELGGGATYAEIPTEDRATVTATLERMSKMLADAGVERIDELDPTRKTALFNDQERVNTLLTRAAENSRLVCRREKQTGSNRATTQCLTVAQRIRARERGEAFMGQKTRFRRSEAFEVD